MDGTVQIDDSLKSTRQVELAKWVITNKVCLTEACYATSDKDICSIAGTSSPGDAAPQLVQDTVIFADYCSSVNWAPFENEYILRTNNTIAIAGHNFALPSEKISIGRLR